VFSPCSTAFSVKTGKNVSAIPYNNGMADIYVFLSGCRFALPF